MKPKLVNIYKFHLCPTLLRRRESNPGLSALCPTTLYPLGYPTPPANVKVIEKPNKSTTHLPDYLPTDLLAAEGTWFTGISVSAYRSSIRCVSIILLTSSGLTLSCYRCVIVCTYIARLFRRPNRPLSALAGFDRVKRRTAEVHLLQQTVSFNTVLSRSE